MTKKTRAASLRLCIEELCLGLKSRSLNTATLAIQPVVQANKAGFDEAPSLNCSSLPPPPASTAVRADYTTCVKAGELRSRSLGRRLDVNDAEKHEKQNDAERNAKKPEYNGHFVSPLS